MKKIIALSLLILIAACSSKKEGNMIVKGNIKGLKKGTLYLQKMQDTILVSVDSIKLLGDNFFTLTDNITEPELYYVTFDGNTTDKRILFFGEEGIITVNDNLNNFGFKPEITGSKNQELLNKYYAIARQFNGKELDFIKENFEASRDNNPTRLAEIKKKSDNNFKRRYLYTTNFVITNSDSEAAPYIALTELTSATIKILDTVNNSLSEKVKNSLYGKKFQNFVAKVKKNEQ